MNRATCLKKADECVNGKREQDYGSPESNFLKIADLWSAYYGAPFSANDVAMMMALLKIARISTGQQPKIVLSISRDTPLADARLQRTRNNESVNNRLSKGVI